MEEKAQMSQELLDKYDEMAAKKQKNIVKKIAYARVVAITKNYLPAEVVFVAPAVSKKS
jgi:hypothetical protein